MEEDNEYHSRNRIDFWNNLIEWTKIGRYEVCFVCADCLSFAHNYNKRKKHITNFKGPKRTIEDGSKHVLFQEMMEGRCKMFTNILPRVRSLKLEKEYKELLDQEKNY